MNKDEINGKSFEISILDKAKDGDTLCYKVYNDSLGEFVVGNCHYNTDPQYFTGATNCLNGSCSLSLEDGECNFIAELAIKYDNPSRGLLELKC